MIRYLITYLFSILCCVTLLSDGSLTHSCFYRVWMTTWAIQQQCNNLAPQCEAESNAIRIGLKLELAKPFFEQLESHWVYQCTFAEDKTAELENLDSPYDYLVAVHEPREKLDGNNRIASKNIATEKTLEHLWQWLDTTGCSVVSAASFDFESFSVLLQKANGATMEIASPKLSRQDCNWIDTNRYRQPDDTSEHPAATRNQAVSSPIIKTDDHCGSARLSPGTPRTPLLCKTGIHRMPPENSRPLLQQSSLASNSAEHR